MRNIVGLLGLLLMTSIAEAGPIADPAPWVLPVNAFAKAKVGDWTILEGDAVLNGRTIHEREIIRVGSIKDGVAEIQLFEGQADREGWFLSFPLELKRGPDTNLLFDVPWIAVDMTKAKASCTLGDASFACTTITYRTGNHRVTVLMAPRVRGSGIVSFEMLKPGVSKPWWKMATVGYGTAGKVEWGQGPPRADLEGNWDGGAAAVDMREGTVPAADDVYEDPEPGSLGVPPRVDLGTCKVSGDQDQNIVRRYVLRELRPIEDRYIAAIAAKPKLGGGTVDLTFTIDEHALATDLAAAGSAPAGIRSCVADTMKAVQFPYSDSGGPSNVTCSFTFDPGKPPLKKPPPRKLIAKGHPARGGADLRGLQRIP